MPQRYEFVAIWQNKTSLFCQIVVKLMQFGKIKAVLWLATGCFELKRV